MSRDKHNPWRLGRYIDIHRTILEQFLRDGFVVSEDLSFERINGFILLEGRVHCLGGIYIAVAERLVIVQGEGTEAMVERAGYSYNVVLEGVGNIFRYDSPHTDHNREHHVHRYDVLEGDSQGAIDFIYDEEKRPTLSEVTEEARQWYYEHYDELGSAE